MSARRHLRLAFTSGAADPLPGARPGQRFWTVERPDPRKHPDWRPGYREPPGSGRLVYDTGKVNIGEHAGVQQQTVAPRMLDWQRQLPPMSADQEWLQQLLAARGQARDRVQERGHRVAAVVCALGLVGTIAYLALSGGAR